MAAGLVVGAVLLGTIIPIVQDVPPRPDVAILVGALTLVLMGALVGYHSPGKTLLEPGGAAVLLALLALLLASRETPISPALWMLSPVAGAALGAGGGWIGEVLQDSVRAGPMPGVSWPWVLVGGALGVVLNVYAVFIPRGLFDWHGLALLLTFSASFFAAGFMVGYLSPGVTLLEPALAGVVMIVGDLGLITVGFSTPFPLLVAVMAAPVAFVVALVGGYVGEVAFALRHRASMGGSPGEFAPVPLPDESEKARR